MIIKKINESYHKIDGTYDELYPITQKLTLLKPNAKYNKKIELGLEDPYEYLYLTYKNNNSTSILVPSGLIHLLGLNCISPVPEYTLEDVKNYFNVISLPFKPYDYQIQAFYESLMNYQQINLMCTGSGKSLTLTLLADFLRTKGKKGLIIVPNINLLTQLKSDIKEYNLLDLYNNTFVIGGGQNIRNFNSDLTISTWQSLMSYKKNLNEIDYILVDEAHFAKGDELSDIIKKTINAKYKIAFTGTLPMLINDQMKLTGLFGVNRRYITTKQLIDRGLATPVQINTLKLKYSSMDKAILKYSGDYQKSLSFIKEHNNRTLFVSRLAINISKKTGNTMILFQHTNHGKNIFLNIMNELYPEVEVKNKDIVGKNAFTFQSKYKVYFINGEVEGKVREEIRLILDSDKDAIIVGNFRVMSTGVNIKNLHNMIFASPLKAYTTITQAIGRGVRLHISKEFFNIYDLVDEISSKCIFNKQYEERMNHSYLPEEFPIIEREILI